MNSKASLQLALLNLSVVLLCWGCSAPPPFFGCSENSQCRGERICVRNACVDPGSTDTGSTDTGSTDTGSTDTGSTDTGSTDIGSSDTGTADAACVRDCGGSECGPDGCGGTCGACGPGFSCSASGQCKDAFCGNGRLDPQESCDHAIPPGEEGECPTQCPDDGNPCTEKSYFGRPADCDAECRTLTIINCIDGDSCCPDGCRPVNDNDCEP